MIIHNIVQGSIEWYQLRLGKVTGTRFKQIGKADYLSLIDELIGEELSEQIDDNSYVSFEMQRGIDLEPLAIEAYKERTGIATEKVGFIQSEEWPRLGMSPDGIYGITGGVETKCPSSKKHIQYLRQNQLPNDYKGQVLSTFLINPSLEWWDFVSFDPRIPQCPLFIHRTKRDDILGEISEATDALNKFFKKMDEIKTKILFPDPDKSLPHYLTITK